MKAFTLKLYNFVAANPSVLSTLGVIGVAVTSRFGFQVTANELGAVAVGVLGGFAHKAHTSATAGNDTTLNAGQ